MRIAVISDAHANLEALGAVLASARAEGARRLLCLGDSVGYHADPNECVALLEAREAVGVAGNHDRAATGAGEPPGFSRRARRAILWTRGQLTAESRRLLGGLPVTRVVDDRWLLFHAALHPEPNPDLHLASPTLVARTFAAFEARYPGLSAGFFGHTHRAVAYERRGGALRVLAGPTVRLSPGARYLVNPGSVGQPRDGDPRAAFALLDPDRGELTFHRVAFDRDACLAKARRAGLLDGEPSPVRRSLASAVDLLGDGAAAVRRRLAR